jgi:hypothetical protein
MIVREALASKKGQVLEKSAQVLRSKLRRSFIKAILDTWYRTLEPYIESTNHRFDRK